MATEIWKQITIAPFNGKYKISESGRIKIKGFFTKHKGNWHPEKFLSPTTHPKGYLRTRLCKAGESKSFYVHRLVGLHFVPNPENKPCINHKDGNKLNNHFSNLEWCTVDENNEHAINAGLVKDNPGIISKEDRQFIVDNILIVGRTELATKFNVSEDYVLRIANINGVKVRGTEYRKKKEPKYKEIVNIETNESFISTTLAKHLGIPKREVNRMIAEERKPNTSPYRYTGRYIGIDDEQKNKISKCLH